MMFSIRCEYRMCLLIFNAIKCILISVHFGDWGINMEVTAKELRIQSGKIIEFAAEGNEVTVTYRGKPMVKIVPFKKDEMMQRNAGDRSAYGLWKDKSDLIDVDNYVRSLRQERKV